MSFEAASSLYKNIFLNIYKTVKMSFKRKTSMFHLKMKWKPDENYPVKEIHSKNIDPKYPWFLTWSHTGVFTECVVFLQKQLILL